MCMHEYVTLHLAEKPALYIIMDVLSQIIAKQFTYQEHKKVRRQKFSSECTINGHYLECDHDLAELRGLSQAPPLSSSVRSGSLPLHTYYCT